MIAENIIEQIKGLRKINPNPNSTKIYNFILDNGESFSGRELNKEEEKELEDLLQSPLYKPRHCYYNSQIIAVTSDYEYYEGYAHTDRIGINLEHGWLVKNNKVFDPTWKDGIEYFGIKIPKEYLRKKLLKCGVARGFLLEYIYDKLNGELK